MAQVNFIGTFPQALGGFPDVPSNFIKSQLLCLTERQMIDYYWLCKTATINKSATIQVSAGGNPPPTGTVSETRSDTIDKISGATVETDLVCYSTYRVFNLKYGGNTVGIGNQTNGVGTWFTQIYRDPVSNLYYAQAPVNYSITTGQVDSGTNVYELYANIFSYPVAFADTTFPVNGNVGDNNIAFQKKMSGTGYSISINGWTVSCPLFCQFNQYNYYYGPNPPAAPSLSGATATASVAVTSASNWSYSA